MTEATPRPDRLTREPTSIVRSFDAKAATWDNNPARQALTQAIAEEILRLDLLRPDRRALEYGCGTAGLSVLLAGRVREIVAVDASEGMIEQARVKLEKAGIANIVTRVQDWTREPPPAERFDLIVTAMALHHVEDTDSLLRTFASLLTPGGTLVLADLVTEPGTFHRDMAVPHHGFEPDTFARMLARLGFASTRWRLVHALSRPDRDYPVFVLAATRLPNE